MDTTVEQALNDRGYSVALAGEWDQYLVNAVKSGGEKLMYSEIEKFNVIKRECGLNPGTKIVPSHFTKA